MLDERTNWPRLYAVAVLLGAGFGLLLSLGVLPSAPDWPGDWGVDSGPISTIVVPVAGGAFVGLALAAAAHLGVRMQLRRRSRRDIG
jgi:hypothetical protein